MDIGVFWSSVVMLVVPGPDTSPVAPAGLAAPPAPAEETAPVASNTIAASPLGHKWASLARPFGSKPAANDVIGIDLGTDKD
ncbi:hypothetical protein CKAN_01362200 [Cinnamomum micranthum f. kanehirae]|uniref:Uncharacterized protein n=1 Tax=Cinnamomum micranthum f. kanehirae TaxID=337451 RepID=A0A443P263_9MAGN|nr:hypothetical protein CKAN_01362200 [Cinnamomum micranthum f. kanehirae]